MLVARQDATHMLIVASERCSRIMISTIDGRERLRKTVANRPID
jgi:hypothetical protein